MKNKGLTITLIVLLSIIVILLTIILIWGINGEKNYIWTKKNYIEEVVYDELLDKSYNNIKISSTAGDIEIKNSTDNTYRIIIYGKDNLVTVSKDSTLDIDVKSEKCFGFCFNQKLSKIILYLPQDYAGNIDINSKYGDINIDYFNTAEITINSDYGDVKINEAKLLNINTKAGDVAVGKVNNIKVSNNYGDIKVDWVNNYLDIKADCGDIKINNAYINENSSINNSFGDITIKNTSEIYIDAHTSLGDVKVKNNNRQSEIVLKVDNSCGDITVEN